MQVVVLATGGTIDKAYPRGAGAYAFEIASPPAAVDILREAHAHDVDVQQVLRKDSTDITDADRAALCDTLRRIHAERGVRLFVVTHGTDTMVQTARALWPVCVELGLRAVLCGARLPNAFKGSDAPFALGFALAAARAQPQGHGAWLAMQGRIWSAPSVRYNTATCCYEDDVQ